MFTTRFIGGVYDYSPTFFTLKVVLSLLTILFLFKVLHEFILKAELGQLKKLSLMLVTLFVLGVLSELGFMFVSRSFATSYPLADQNWERKNWNPINSLGYRAGPIDALAFNSKKNILVVGSSYTSGGGIDNIEDRYTEQLNAKLPENYLVHNLGMSGTEIIDGYRRLNEYVVEPDILIISHTIRSIQALMPKDSRRKLRLDLHEQLNPLLGFFVKGSYLINYYFWKIYAPDIMMKRYIDNIESVPISLYSKKEKLVEHFKNLQKFITYCEIRSIPLLVILFPTMSEYIDLSNSIASVPIEKFLKSKNITTISVFELVRELPVETRVVNSTDRHPSVEVHRIVANELYEVLNKGKMIQ